MKFLKKFFVKLAIAMLVLIGSLVVLGMIPFMHQVLTIGSYGSVSLGMMIALITMVVVVSKVKV